MKSIFFIFELYLLMTSVLSSSYKPGDAYYKKEKLPTTSSWASLDYAFPNSRERLESINRGDFIPGVAVPLDMDVIKSKLKFKHFLLLQKNFILNFISFSI